MIEEWKIYKDTTIFPHGYLWEVSTLGRVKKDGKIINLPIDKKGYYRLGNMLVHRMVAEVFIPNHDNKPCVEHIDTNKLNNRIDNLKWCTYSENNNNPITIERRKKSLKGRIITPEWRKHISENSWIKDRGHSEETKKLLSEKKKLYWANKKAQNL